jgi:hypothetical protein
MLHVGGPMSDASDASDAASGLSASPSVAASVVGALGTQPASP